MKKFWKKYKRPIVITVFGSAAVVGFIGGSAVSGVTGGIVGAVTIMVAIPVFSLALAFCGVAVCAVMTLLCACIGWALGDNTAFDAF